jgi:glutamyl/glutaminyl-tRNA synthetase
VTTYRDAGFLPQAFVNFLCLLGWSPKNDREFLTLDELRDRAVHARRRQPRQRRHQFH